MTSVWSFKIPITEVKMFSKDQNTPYKIKSDFIIHYQLTGLPIFKF